MVTLGNEKEHYIPYHSLKKSIIDEKYVFVFIRPRSFVCNYTTNFFLIKFDEESFLKFYYYSLFFCRFLVFLGWLSVTPMVIHRPRNERLLWGFQILKAGSSYSSLEYGPFF